MDNDWRKQLRREASACGMCKENREALAGEISKEDAVSLYKKTIDWALEEGYPRINTLRRYFSDCDSLGVFIDRTFHGETLDDQQVYVFHHCSGMIRVGLNAGKRIIPMLYFANDCDMAIKPAGPRNMGTRVPLYIFGDNIIKATDTADVVYKMYKFEVK